MPLIDVNESLDELYAKAPVFPIGDGDRIVVLSDLHMGNGGARDDFARNADLCLAVLRDYYLARGYWLILNGDVEERQRFTAEAIRGRWPELFETFSAFERGPGFTRLAGNHDKETLARGESIDALRLVYGGDNLFVFHSHQATILYESWNRLVGLVLRYLAQPLGIGNRSVAHDRAKKFVIEKRVYEFSARRRIASIIAHTHRPLFESMSKTDTLRFKIEQLCRRYAESSGEEQQRFGATIRKLKADLGRVGAGGDRQLASLYDDALLHVPCIFNSGCVIGKTGLTALEIAGGRIGLVHWFDTGRSTKYLDDSGYTPWRLAPRSPYWRVVLKEDSLGYVFTRIRLLADSEPQPEVEEDASGFGLLLDDAFWYL